MCANKNSQYVIKVLVLLKFFFFDLCDQLKDRNGDIFCEWSDETSDDLFQKVDSEGIIDSCKVFVYEYADVLDVSQLDEKDEMVDELLSILDLLK